MKKKKKGRKKKKQEKKLELSVKKVLKQKRRYTYTFNLFSNPILTYSCRRTASKIVFLNDLPTNVCES